MKISYKTVATLGQLGYFPAPGTLGTCAALPLVVIIKFLNFSSCYEVLVLVISTLSACVVVYKALDFFQPSDPKQIIIDEVVGFLWAMLFVPLGVGNCTLAFLLFRLFDIYKPWPIYYCEKLPHAWGVVADDVAAGILTAALMAMFKS